MNESGTSKFAVEIAKGTLVAVKKVDFCVRQSTKGVLLGGDANIKELLTGIYLDGTEIRAYRDLIIRGLKDFVNPR